jgi:large subunit ribosomal protein L28
MAGHNVSHSHLKTKRRFLPNLQWYREDKGEQRIKICAECFKTMSKVEKVKEPKPKTKSKPKSE